MKTSNVDLYLLYPLSVFSHPNTQPGGMNDESKQPRVICNNFRLQGTKNLFYFRVAPGYYFSRGCYQYHSLQRAFPIIFVCLLVLLLFFFWRARPYHQSVRVARGVSATTRQSQADLLICPAQ